MLMDESGSEEWLRATGTGDKCSHNFTNNGTEGKDDGMEGQLSLHAAVGVIQPWLSSSLLFFLRFSFFSFDERTDNGV